MKDNFSEQAEEYVRYRPVYPESLFEFIAGHIKNKQLAWDVGTGNGQTAVNLAAHFEEVIATDISEKQLAHAVPHPRVHYSVQPAEKTSIAPGTVDLVTISQALHWFDHAAFYREVNRVAASGAVIAAWSYSLLQISPAIDEVIRRLYHDIIGSFWDPERCYVDEEYRTIPFPFEEIAVPSFSMNYSWTMNELAGYLNTWSAVRKFIAMKHYNPVDNLVEMLKMHSIDVFKVTFPLHIRMGRVRQ